MPQSDDVDSKETPVSADRFVCARCNAFSHHVWTGMMINANDPNSGTWARPFDDQPGRFRVVGTDIRIGRGGPAQWRVSLCSSCDKPSVWRGDARVYPSGSTVPMPHVDMPTEARELYDEASLVLPNSRRAAAALARASLEALLKELDGDGGRKNLQTRIADLNGRINQSLWMVLTALRVVGNDSLHGDRDDLVILYLEGEAAEVVEPFFGAINALVEELITQPRKARELYDAIPQAKREAAERAMK